MDVPGLKVFVISSSQLGAKETDTANVIGLMHGPHIQHYWDGDKHVGTAVQRLLPDLVAPAWDVWMVYAPGATWDDAAPEPTWWEHQLPPLDRSFGDRRLDAGRFARKAREISRQRPAP